MYSLAAIKYARDNSNEGDAWHTFLADMDEYEAEHPQKAQGVFVQMGIAGKPQFPSVSNVSNRASELETLTKPIATWLAEKWNPHAKVVVSSARAEVVCGELAVIHDA